MDAVQEKHDGMQGQWQHESPFLEVLEQVKRSAGTDCGPQTTRRAYNAKKFGNWDSFNKECRKDGKRCEWTEAYDKVAAMEDIGRLSIVQDILRKSTGVLRRIIAPVDGMGGVTLSYACPHCSCFPLDDKRWRVTTGTRRRQQ